MHDRAFWQRIIECAHRAESEQTTLPEGTLLITGVPGSGKSTVAKEIGKAKGLKVVSTDDLSPEPGSRYPGTDAALKYLKTMRSPAIVEGTALLGINPALYADTPIMLVAVNRKELLQRLVDRGMHTEEGDLLKGDKDKAEIRKEMKAIAPFKSAFRAAASKVGRTLYRKPPKEFR